MNLCFKFFFLVCCFISFVMSQDLTVWFSDCVSRTFRWTDCVNILYRLYQFSFKEKTYLMHNLSSVYLVKNLYTFRAYLKPIFRRYTIWTQHLVLIVLFRWLSVILAARITERVFLDEYIEINVQQNIKIVSILFMIPPILFNKN
jgi:hypothetical protein